MITVIPSDIVFGLSEPLPLKDFPNGRVKIKMRSKNVAVAYVKTSDGIRKFCVASDGANWFPKFELQRNFRQ